MAKQRIVNTKFWDDAYITRLSPTEKLLFLYLITNPLTNIAGVYELPLKRVAFDTGISTDRVEVIYKKLEQDGKLIVVGEWVGIVNFIKHQNLNSKIKTGIKAELKGAPQIITDRLSIDYQALYVPSDSPSHSNSDPTFIPNNNSHSISNPNSNALPFKKLSTGIPQDIMEGKRALANKYRVSA